MRFQYRKYLGVAFFGFNIILYYFISECFEIEFNIRFSFITIITFLSYYLFGVYDLENRFSEKTYKIELFLFVFTLNFFPFSLIFFSKILDFSTAFILFSTIFFFQIIFKGIILKAYFFKRKLIIIGNNPQTKEIKNSIKKTHLFELSKIFIDDNEIENITDYVKKNNIEFIVNTTNNITKKELISLLDLKLHKIKILNFYSFYELVENKIPVDFISKNEFIGDSNFKMLNSQLIPKIKRIFDILFSSSLLIITFPMIIISAIIIKLESKGSVIFKQTRIGIENRPFTIYKLRSMKIHDENEFSKYVEDYDPRVTKFGKIIRMSRIDELPQLINVLKGEMSIVGPRAEWDKLSNEYLENVPLYRLRFLIKPGLTGWAQVNYPYGENTDDAKQKLMYDLYYIKNFSFFLELNILFKTLKTIIFVRGK